MRLTDLIDLPGATFDPEVGALDVRGLTADSRAVGPGFVFAALPGTKVDGRSFIPDALAKGAVAILSTPDAEAVAGTALPLIADANPRRRLARMAARFHGRQPDRIVAVTGTNGKTSVAAFAQQIWNRLGVRAASLGTLGIQGPAVTRKGSLTTPDPVSLQADMAHLAEAGIRRLAIEASSHGLDQYRLDGLEISAAAFTNLTRDHIDYHGTMEAYLAAKLRLFTEVMADGGTAVINADSDHAETVAEACRAHGHAIVAYGRAANDDGIRLDEIAPEADGLTMSFTLRGRPHRVRLPLAGTFQAMNALCALGLVVFTDGDDDAAVAALGGLAGAPGRLQRVARLANGATVYVDYAHTPDALETVLRALRPHAESRLLVIVGCGGDRDPGKRPMMGEIAAREADVAYVTDDNPRSEEPALIRAAILAACPGGIEIGDRAEAIETAMRALGPGDLLVVAGKGHEQGQIVGDTVHPFDDAQVARDTADRLGEAA